MCREVAMSAKVFYIPALYDDIKKRLGDDNNVKITHEVAEAVLVYSSRSSFKVVSANVHYGDDTKFETSDILHFCDWSDLRGEIQNIMDSSKTMADVERRVIQSITGKRLSLNEYIGQLRNQCSLAHDVNVMTKGKPVGSFSDVTWNSIFSQIRVLKRIDHTRLLRWHDTKSRFYIIRKILKDNEEIDISKFPTIETIYNKACDALRLETKSWLGELDENMNLEDVIRARKVIADRKNRIMNKNYYHVGVIEDMIAKRDAELHKIQSDLERTVDEQARAIQEEKERKEAEEKERLLENYMPEVQEFVMNPSFNNLSRMVQGIVELDLDSVAEVSSVICDNVHDYIYANERNSTILYSIIYDVLATHSMSVYSKLVVFLTHSAVYVEGRVKETVDMLNLPYNTGTQFTN